MYRIHQDNKLAVQPFIPIRLSQTIVIHTSKEFLGSSYHPHCPQMYNESANRTFLNINKVR
jgi:hypothetical protein